MAYITQFFTVDYWFGFPPFITVPLLIISCLVFAIFLCGGIASIMLYPKIENRWKRQVVRHAGTGAAWIGFIGLLLVFMRYERIPVFMYRYWFLFLAIGAAVWIIRVRRYALHRREKLEQETRAYHTKEKYLQQ